MRVQITCCVLFLGAFLATTYAPAPKATPKPTPKPTKPPPTPDKLKCKVFNAVVKLTTEAYKDALASPYNADFIRLRLEVEAGVMQVYENEKAFVGVSVMNYAKAADGKANAAFVIEFSTNSTHLVALLKQLATKKLGKLDTDGKFVKYGCYVPPPPPTCVLPCPSLCAPACGSSCCGQYAYPAPTPVYAPPPPPPVMIPPPPPPPQCPPTCAPACAPACTPTCCANTAFPPAQYGKRHQTPHPKDKAHKKHHKKHDD